MCGGESLEPVRKKKGITVKDLRVRVEIKYDYPFIEVGNRLEIHLPNGKVRSFAKRYVGHNVEVLESDSGRIADFSSGYGSVLRAHDISTAHRAIKRLVVREYNQQQEAR